MCNRHVDTTAAAASCGGSGGDGGSATNTATSITWYEVTVSDVASCRDSITIHCLVTGISKVYNISEWMRRHR